MVPSVPQHPGSKLASQPAVHSRWLRYRRLSSYALAHWQGWIVIIAVTLSSSALAVLQPWPMKILVDHVLGTQPMPEWLVSARAWIPWADSARGLLAWIVITFLAVFVINSVSEVILTIAWVQVGQRMVFRLAADLFSRLQRRSLIFHSRNSVGDLLGRVATDSWCIYKFVDAILFGPLRALILLVGMAVLMWQADPTLTLIALAVLPAMLLSSAIFGRLIRVAARARREIESGIQSHVHQMLSGIPVVQAFTREHYTHERFRQLADRVIHAHRRSTLLGSLSALSSGLTTVCGTGLVLWMGATRVFEGELSLGELLVFLSYLTTLQLQFKTFAGVYASLQEQAASWDRVNEILQIESEIHESPHAKRLHGVQGRIDMVDVTFGYQSGRPALEHISLNIQPGETVALVGDTGAGKSTLAALIPRLFDPWEGRVLIDGIDVRSVTLESLRSKVAMVLQEPFLLPVTIAENIAFGRPSASRGEIEAAALAANADAFIRKLPVGYDTVLGERAATLSGGERQRLAIARAMLADAPILILDEPTSALDGDTEQLVLQSLERLMRGKTTLIIAHRFSTIRRVERIAVLQKGRIVEQGDHDTLVAADGAYSRLYRRHTGSRLAQAFGSGEPQPT
jgi:ATP-binding cassette subfamily B protein/subfamily B ATP-binding cassette protein MsbA